MDRLNTECCVMFEVLKHWTYESKFQIKINMVYIFTIALLSLCSVELHLNAVHHLVNSLTNLPFPFPFYFIPFRENDSLLGQLSQSMMKSEEMPLALASMKVSDTSTIYSFPFHFPFLMCCVCVCWGRERKINRE